MLLDFDLVPLSKSDHDVCLKPNVNNMIVLIVQAKFLQLTLIDLIDPKRFPLQDETSVPDIGLRKYDLVNTNVCT